MQGGRKALEPFIPTSDVRGSTPDTSCEETRRLFETDYSTHKKRTVKRRARRSTASSSTRPPKPKVEAVRKSTRLATRPATPIDADCSATDVSVVGSTRSASVASVRNPTPKPKAKLAKPKSTPRPRPSPDLERLTPQPTSIAHSPEDPPPPAPTHVVPLRPGYNAYTEADKLWFFQFLVWVFRQNAHAGKAEICQDIFQQVRSHLTFPFSSFLMAESRPHTIGSRVGSRIGETTSQMSRSVGALHAASSPIARWNKILRQLGHSKTSSRRYRVLGLYPPVSRALNR